MSTDGQTPEKVYETIPIDPAAAYQGAVDRLMPVQARERKSEERQQAIAARLNDDPEFWATNLDDLNRDSVLTVTEVAAITLEINHLHRWAKDIDWARKYGQYATGEAATALKNLVTRTNRIAVHFKLQPSDRLAVDEGLDFAADRQWHVPPALQAKSTPPNKRMMPAEAAGASGDVEPLLTSEPKHNAATGPVFSMTRRAMIDQHEHQWPNIARNLKGAHGNGLSAAKAGARGWNEAAALAWARANNELINVEKPTDALTKAMNSMGRLPSRKHTLQG